MPAHIDQIPGAIVKAAGALRATGTAAQAAAASVYATPPGQPPVPQSADAAQATSGGGK